MKIAIADPQRSILLGMPTYTPFLLGLEGRNDTAVIIRVDDLASFLETELPITIKFVAYRGRLGAWVVCVAFRVVDDAHDPLEGDTYLNPRQAFDYELLLKLSRQKIFPIIFLAPDLRDAVGKRISWRDTQREEVFRAVMAMQKDLRGEKLTGNYDPDFGTAKEEFQKSFSLRDLLSGA